jgi:hypothetical protein
MPYAPGITDRSGEILAAGIAQAAQEYADSNEKMQLTQKEIDHLAGTVQFAAQKGILKPEEVQQFAQGNLSKKREIASRAGMLYQDMQAAADRATISPEMAAELKAAGYLAAPVGGGRLQYLQMPEKPWQPSAEDLQTATNAGLVPVPVGKGRFQFVEKPRAEWQFDPTKDVVPIPGGGQFVRTSPSGGGNVMPGTAATPFDPATAPRVNVSGREGIVVPDGKGGVRVQFPPGAASGTVAKPMDAATATMFGTLTQELGKIDAELIDHAQQIATGDNRFGFLNNSSRAERVKELQSRKAGIEAQLTAMRPVATPRTEPQPSTVRTPAPKTAPQVKPSAGDRAKFAGPTMPASDALPVADPLQGSGDTGGDVLPPLPTEDGIPTLSPDEARKLPAGTKFRTLDGRVMTKG